MYFRSDIRPLCTDAYGNQACLGLPREFPRDLFSKKKKKVFVVRDNGVFVVLGLPREFPCVVVWLRFSEQTWCVLSVELDTPILCWSRGT
jgi:hypothetical protein